MELKKEFLKMLKEDDGFRNEIKFLLDLDEMEYEIKSLKI